MKGELAEWKQAVLGGVRGEGAWELCTWGQEELGAVGFLRKLSATWNLFTCINWKYLLKQKLF